MMRTQGAISKVLIAVLALSIAPFAAHSAEVITEGDLCKIHLIQKKYEGNTFICIKKLDRLVWEKSKSPNGHPSQHSSKQMRIPRSGDAPLRRDGCGTGSWHYRISGNVMERSFYAARGFSSVDNRKDSSFHPIRVKAFQAVRDQFKANKEVKTQIQIHASNSFPPQLLNELLRQLRSHLAFWAEYFPSDSNVQATFFTGKDRDFGNNSKETMSGALETYFLNELNKVKVFNCSLDGGISGAHLINSGLYRGQAGYWFASNTPPQLTNWAPAYQPHELTHSVQALIVPDIFALNLPVNFHEGGAEFFGLSMGFPKLAWYSDELDKRIAEKDMNEFVMEIKTRSDVIKMLKLTEGPAVARAGGEEVPNSIRWAYSIGSLLWEWVTAEYGYEAYWNVLKSLNKTGSYDQSMIEVLGMTKSELYEQASPYVLYQIKRVLAKEWKNKWKAQ